MPSTAAETFSLLDDRGVEIHVAETRKAAAIYNDLASRGIAVGGLFHSTR